MADDRVVLALARAKFFWPDAAMADVSVYDTGNGLSALLDRVERGEEVVITRRGKAVARLVPAGPPDRPRAAVAGLRALRADLANRGVSFTSTELQAMRDEGRR